jgi:hypothetical protein
MLHWENKMIVEIIAYTIYMIVMWEFLKKVVQEWYL